MREVSWEEKYTAPRAPRVHAACKGGEAIASELGRNIKRGPHHLSAVRFSPCSPGSSLFSLLPTHLEVCFHCELLERSRVCQALRDDLAGEVIHDFDQKLSHDKLR